MWHLMLRLFRPKSIDEALAVLIFLVFSIGTVWWINAFALGKNFDVSALFKAPPPPLEQEIHPADQLFTFLPGEKPFVMMVSDDVEDLQAITEAEQGGWDGVTPLQIIITKTAYVGASSVDQAALNLSAASGNDISVINYGQIIGAGGAGGAGADSNFPRMGSGNNGGNGGPAIESSGSYNLANFGTIAAGGGGGGGGGGTWLFYSGERRIIYSGGGGGGGQGSIESQGGSAGNIEAYDRDEIEEQHLPSLAGLGGSRSHSGAGGAIDPQAKGAAAAGGAGGAIGQPGEDGIKAPRGGSVQAGRTPRSTGGTGGKGGKPGYVFGTQTQPNIMFEGIALGRR